jgi:hypothetical protein
VTSSHHHIIADPTSVKLTKKEVELYLRERDGTYYAKETIIGGASVIGAVNGGDVQSRGAIIVI